MQNRWDCGRERGQPVGNASALEFARAIARASVDARYQGPAVCRIIAERLQIPLMVAPRPRSKIGNGEQQECKAARRPGRDCPAQPFEDFPEVVGARYERPPACRAAGDREIDPGKPGRVPITGRQTPGTGDGGRVRRSPAGRTGPIRARCASDLRRGSSRHISPVSPRPSWQTRHRARRPSRNRPRSARELPAVEVEKDLPHRGRPAVAGTDHTGRIQNHGIEAPVGAATDFHFAGGFRTVVRTLVRAIRGTAAPVGQGPCEDPADPPACSRDHPYGTRSSAAR